MNNKFVRVLINLVITIVLTIILFTVKSKNSDDMLQCLYTHMEFAGLFNLLFFIEFLIFDGNHEKMCFIKNAVYLLITILTIAGFALLLTTVVPARDNSLIPFWVYYGIIYGIATAFVLVPFFNIIQANDGLLDDEYFYPFTSVIGYVVGIGCCMGVSALGKFAPFLYKYGGLIIFGVSLIGFIVYFKKNGFPFYKMELSTNKSYQSPSANASQINREQGTFSSADGKRISGGCKQLEKSIRKICSEYSTYESLGNYWSVNIKVSGNMGFMGNSVDISISLPCDASHIYDEDCARLAKQEIEFELPKLVESLRKNISNDINNVLNSLRETYCDLDGEFKVKYSVKKEVYLNV